MLFRSLFGTDASTAMVVLQSLGADAVGVNCSTGPEQMAELVREMKEYANIPIIAKPNDGMPEVVDGETVYRMTPEEFAEEEKKAENVFEIEVEEKLPTRNIILIYDTEYPQSIASKEFQKFLSSQKN